MRCIITICIILSSLFQLQAQSGLQKAEWFMDNDPGFHNANRVNFAPNNDEVEWSFELDNLELGVHYLGTRVLNDKGVWSHTLIRSFLVLPPADPNISYIEYFIDNDPGFGNAIEVPLSDETVTFELDLNNLVAGVHYLFVRVQQPSGVWSNTLTRSFLVLPPAQPNMVYAEWYIDEDPGFGRANPVDIVADTAAWEIDLSELEVGVHYLHVRTQQASGAWTHTLTRSFLVVEDGESPIERVDYTYTPTNGGAPLSFSFELSEPRHFIDIDFQPDTTGLIGGETYELCFSVVTVLGARSSTRCLTFEAQGEITNVNTITDNDIVQVYPNPASNLLKISIDHQTTIRKFVMFNVDGKEVITQESSNPITALELDVSFLKNGLYILTLESDNKLIIRRILVQ